MNVTRETVDDVLRFVFRKLIRSTDRVVASRGDTRELTAVLLELTNPRARVSRAETRGKITSCIAEFLWHMSKGNNLEFIAYYLPKYREESEDGLSVYGGYGPRFFGAKGFPNQIESIVRLLRTRPNTRRAVIQIFDAHDIVGQVRKEIPCTCTLQFLIRNGRLQMITSMRSNDAFKGLPHDIFAFTMIQEALARQLGVELGTYRHFVGSLHLYQADLKKARVYLSEGWQDQCEMPPMPKDDTWRSIEYLIKLEGRVRVTNTLPRFPQWLDQYWKDLALFLLAYSADKKNNQALVGRARERIGCPFFQVYLDKN